MMSRIAVLGLALLTIAGCGGGSADGADEAPLPEEAEDCPALADAVVAINQELLDRVGEMTVDELDAAGGPASFEEWVADARVAARRSTELRCESELPGLLAERADRLEAAGPAGAALVDDFRANVGAD